jgi:cysteine-rich repeat protein
MRAAVEDGANILGWRGSPPAFRPFAVVQNLIPAAREEVDASLVPCPLCGNRMEEPPETCDDGNRADGDGCSSSCQLEPGSTRTPTPTDTPAVTPT